jgi:hypothetical protein
LLEFKDNAKNICVIPNIYILTENIKDIKQKFEKDENIKNLNNYYQYNEIINFDKIKDCLRNEIIPKKWIEVDDYFIRCKCSICGWESHKYEDDVYGMPYCPNCGTCMKGADDETAMS